MKRFRDNHSARQTKMSPTKRHGKLLGVLILCLLFEAKSSAAFWLTDTSLFQPALILQEAVESKLNRIDQSQQKAPTVAAGDLPAAARPPNTTSSSSSSSSSSNASANNKSDIQSIDKQQTGQCSPCNADSLEARARDMLAKWTSSAQFAAQVRQLSEAAGAESNNQRRNRNTSHNTGSWSTARGKWSHMRRSEQSTVAATTASQQAQSKMSQQQPPPPPPPLQQVKVVQGERGPRGARGPRGTSVLISVRDRNELFDLPSAANDDDDDNEQVNEPVDGPTKTTTTRNEQAKTSSTRRSSAAAPKQRHRLAFVEQEQLLAVETTSGEWRPVQLLAPLRDFRKTVAEFSVQSAADRRRLLAAAGTPISGQDGHQLKAANSLLAASVWSASQEARRLARRRPLAIARGDSSNGVRLVNADELRDEDNELDVDGQQDNYDDDDDDDDEDDDVDDDDDDAEDVDGEGGDDEEKDGQPNQDDTSNSILGPSATMSRVRDVVAESLSSSSSAEATRRKAPISGRSALAATRGGAATNDKDETESALGEQNNALVARILPTSESSAAMKLRLVALNEPFSGNLHGLRGVNLECKRNAARAQVRGAFRALLATNYQSLGEIVRQASAHKYPIVNLRGETLASSWTDLFRTPARAPNPLGRIYSFDGRLVGADSNWPNKLVWLGAGNRYGQRDAQGPMQNCDSWHSDSLTKFGYAVPLHSHPARGQRTNQHRGQHISKSKQDRRQPSNSNELLAAGNSSSQAAVFDGIQKFPCRMPLIVLCVETVAQTVD